MHMGGIFLLLFSCSAAMDSFKTANPASRNNAAQSAPEYPSAQDERPICSKSTSAASLRPEDRARSIETRSFAVGNGTYKSLSRRPGRIMAGSINSGRFVAAITKTDPRLPNPSISVSNWFTTRSETPPPPPPSEPRLGQSESSSSKKTTHGLEERARSNTKRTDRSDSPTYLSNNSGPFTERKLAPDSLAMAFANNVLPHPGGPYNNTPAGRDRPSDRNFSG
mmetsp:Transcript_16518/g.19042  ORF Transcript_16518/g.19042 Transcript_16518/m.19042 type:complete len:223 (+) Transcript_16518:269-937(+)